VEGNPPREDLAIGIRISLMTHPPNHVILNEVKDLYRVLKPPTTPGPIPPLPVRTLVPRGSAGSLGSPKKARPGASLAMLYEGPSIGHTWDRRAGRHVLRHRLLRHGHRPLSRDFSRRTRSYDRISGTCP